MKVVFIHVFLGEMFNKAFFYYLIPMVSLLDCFDYFHGEYLTRSVITTPNQCFVVYRTQVEPKISKQWWSSIRYQ